MPYQQAIFANNEVYHVFNRGIEKRLIFLDKRDYRRFIATLDYYRFKNPPTRFSFRNRPFFLKNFSNLNPLVEIISFCLMPNHFHLLIRQLEENGVSTFISKVSNSYTKYFNTKYKRVGPLLQGSFKAVRMESEEQFIHVSRYIHLNPLIDYLTKDLSGYSYSSYQEFLGIKRGFCQINSIIDHFGSIDKFREFTLDQEEYGRTIKKIERLLLDT